MPKVLKKRVKKRLEKRGVSAVVASVLIVLIVVACVIVVWKGIDLLVSDGLGSSLSCSDFSLSIDTGSGFSCHDSSNNIAGVNIVRGGDSLDLKRLEVMVYDSQGNSRKFIEPALSPGQSKTVYVFLEDDSQAVGVAPVIQVGNTEKRCDAVVKANFPSKRCEIPPNLVNDYMGVWRLDGTSDDVLGFHDGEIYSGGSVLSGAAAQVLFTDDRYGNEKSAIELESINREHVSISPEIIDFNLEELTIEAWIKPSAFAGENRYIVGDIYELLGGEGFALELMSDGRLNFTVSSSVFTRSSVVSSQSLNLNEWYYVVGVFKGNEILKVYINGSEAGDNPFPIDSYNLFGGSVNVRHLLYLGA